MHAHGDSFDSTNATVTASYGRRLLLKLDDGREVQARPKGKTLRAVCGDEVLVQSIDDEQDWQLTRIKKRRNELARTDSRRRREILAANIDLLVVVIAQSPPADYFIMDRFLGAAHLMDCECLILDNKVDLENTNEQVVKQYQAIGYRTIATSATQGTGIEELRKHCRGKFCALVGQSGVGKSSLSNALIPSANERTKTLSRSSKEGRHTTVTAKMLDLPGGGALIDSPGVRDFAPHIGTLTEVALAFPELSSLADQCKFANCLHLAEPGCAVKDAAEDSAIHERRYKSYRRLLNISRGLLEKFS
ncbi:MAG: ribosome small subunit-dependent GTPase A [Pseudomonadota bacterium]